MVMLYLVVRTLLPLLAFVLAWWPVSYTHLTLPTKA